MCGCFLLPHHMGSRTPTWKGLFPFVGVGYKDYMCGCFLLPHHMGSRTLTWKGLFPFLVIGCCHASSFLWLKTVLAQQIWCIIIIIKKLKCYSVTRVKLPALYKQLVTKTHDKNHIYIHTTYTLYFNVSFVFLLMQVYCDTTQAKADCMDNQNPCKGILQADGIGSVSLSVCCANN